MSPHTFSRTIVGSLFLLLLTAAAAGSVAAATTTERNLSFGPFLGCDDDWAFGVPQDDDCYAVDADACSFIYNAQCREVTGRYRYYNGGRTSGGTEPFPENMYHEVTISVLRGCNSGTNTAPSRCTITVDGETCAQCSNNGDDYRTVTLNNCNNIPGVFPSGPQTISLASIGEAVGTAVGGRGAQHLKLAYSEDKCQHPALEVMTPPPVQTMTMTPQIQYSMSSPSNNAALDQKLAQPDESALVPLVANTQDYFSSRLQRLYPVDIKSFSIDDWTLRYSTSGTTTTITAELYLDLTITLTLQELSVITAKEITDYMSSAPVMNGYLRTVVKTADAVFDPTYAVALRVITGGAGGTAPGLP